MLAMAWNWRKRANMHFAAAIPLSLEKKGEFDESCTMLTLPSTGLVQLQRGKTNVQIDTSRAQRGANESSLYLALNLNFADYARLRLLPYGIFKH
jgi:hypothetical protein